MYISGLKAVWVRSVGEMKTYKNPHFDIQESKLHAVKECLVLAINPVIFADIFIEPPEC